MASAVAYQPNRCVRMTAALVLLDLLSDGKWHRVADVQAAMECSRRTAYRWIASAEAARVIEWEHKRAVLGGGRFRRLPASTVRAAQEGMK